MIEKTFVLRPVKSTAGTHVYGETDKARGEAVFPALYLPKNLFPNGPTPTVEVTLKVPS
jgi:hypothetical protein